MFIVKGERFDLIKNPIMKFTVYPQRAVKTVSFVTLPLSP